MVSASLSGIKRKQWIERLAASLYDFRIAQEEMNRLSKGAGLKTIKMLEDRRARAYAEFQKEKEDGLQLFADLDDAFIKKIAGHVMQKVRENKTLPEIIKVLLEQDGKK